MFGSVPRDEKTHPGDDIVRDLDLRDEREQDPTLRVDVHRLPSEERPEERDELLDPDPGMGGNFLFERRDDERAFALYCRDSIVSVVAWDHPLEVSV